MLRKICFLSIFCFILIGIFSSYALSDDYNSRLEAAKKYSKITPASKMLDDVFANISKQLPENQREAFIQQTQALIDVPKLETLMIETMAKHFSTEELNALAEFYGSPLGKSIMGKFGPYMADIQMGMVGQISEVIKKSKEMEQNQ